MRVSFLKAPIGGIIGLEMITFVEPLGIECVAGGLELEGHTCQIVDMRLDGVEPGLAKMRAFGPDIVGLQCNFTTERFRALRLAKEAEDAETARITAANAPPVTAKKRVKRSG